MNLLEQLKQDHQDLLRKMQEVSAEDLTAEDMFVQAFDNLLFHFELEEAVFYPELLTRAETRESAQIMLNAHNIIKELIRALFKGQIRSDALKDKVDIFLASDRSQNVQNVIANLFQGTAERGKTQNKLTLLYEAVSLHYDNEETQLFPVVQSVLTPSELHHMHVQMQAEKDQRQREQAV